MTATLANFITLFKKKKTMREKRGTPKQKRRGGVGQGLSRVDGGL